MSFGLRGICGSALIGGRDCVVAPFYLQCLWIEIFLEEGEELVSVVVGVKGEVLGAKG